MRTVGEVLKLSTDFLQDRNIERPRRAVEELIAHLLGVKRLDLYMQFDRPLEETELKVLRSLLKRCAEGEPLAYLLGSVPFHHCSILVGRSALIPRPETEWIVERIVRILGVPTPLIVWDLCCGTGCMGIALKKALPQLQVTLSDLSSEALSLAQKNAERNGVDVSFLQGDLTAPFAGLKADVIVCNPPYISQNEYNTLDPRVRDFEPKEALLAGPTGVEFYQRLAEELPAVLCPHAKVFLEIGDGQGAQVRQLFSAPHWKKVVLERDLSERERFFFLEFDALLQ